MWYEQIPIAKKARVEPVKYAAHRAILQYRRDDSDKTVFRFTVEFEREGEKRFSLTTCLTAIDGTFLSGNIQMDSRIIPCTRTPSTHLHVTCNNLVFVLDEDLFQHYLE